METVDDLCTGMIHRILVLSVLEKNLNHSQNNGNNSYNGNSDNNRNRYSSDNQSDNKNQAPSIRSSQTTGPSSSSKSYTSSKHTHTQEMKATQSITVTSLVAHWLVELRYPIRSYNQLKQNSCIVLSSCIVLYCIVLYCIVLYCIVLVRLFHTSSFGISPIFYLCASILYLFLSRVRFRSFVCYLFELLRSTLFLLSLSPVSTTC